MAAGSGGRRSPFSTPPARPASLTAARGRRPCLAVTRATGQPLSLPQGKVGGPPGGPLGWGELPQQLKMLHSHGVPPVGSRHLSPHTAAVPACRVRGRAVGLPVAGPLSPAARPTRPTSTRVSQSSALPGKRGDGSSTEQRIGTSFPLRNKRGGSSPLGDPPQARRAADRWGTEGFCWGAAN